MAGVIPGRTRCELCMRVIFKDESFRMYANFISDPNHPLRRFADGAMHEQCFERWPLKDEFLKLYDEVRALWESLRKGCASHEEFETKLREHRRKFQDLEARSAERIRKR